MIVEDRAAVRYAKALLELAIEQNVLEQVHADMQFFRQVCAENRNFELMLQSPVVPHFKKLAVLHAIFEKRVHRVSFTIFDMITRKNREKILLSIAREFHRLYNQHQNILTAQVITTFPLDEPLRKQFMQITQEATGKQVELEEKVDPKLIGGFVLRVGDQQIDESIKGKLQRIAYSFTHS